MNSSRIKILLFLVGILLVTNLVLLVFILGKKDGHEGRRVQQDRSSVMRIYLKDSVGFTDQQLAQFDKLRDQNKQDMKPLFEQMRQSKLAFYNLLKQPGAHDSVTTAAANAMAEKQKAVDMAFYKYFEEVRSLCTPEQQVKYDSLVQQIVRRMISPSRKGDSKQKKEEGAKRKD
ncbi:MAG TPA: Spy/CpxP family protein refolding chaperone [Chitinophagaceae bacterium]|nr:Spy/CpxP family protein refolding chaperone [Chitinophagaceae bacterium]